MNRYLTILFAASGVLLRVSTVSWADPVAPSTATIAAAAAVTPIAIPEITEQADSTEDSLRDQDTELAADKSVETIGHDLRALSAELNPRLVEVGKMMVPGISLDMLREQERTWQQYERELNSWKDELAKRATRLDADIATLNRTETTWVATATDVKTSGAPAGLAQTADGVVAAVRQTRQTMEGARRDTLGLLVRIAQTDSRVDRALGRLERARDQALSRLFTRDGDPIWKAQGQTAGEISQQGQQSVQAQVSALSAYLKRRPADVAVHFLIFAVLTVLLFRLKRQTPASASDNESAALQIFNRPFDDALLLSIVLAPWIYPQAPRLLWACLGAVALIPTVLVLRRLFDRSFHSLLYAIVLFYFVDQLRSVMASLPFVARIIFETEMAAGLLFLGWYTLTGPLSKRSAPTLDRRSLIVRRVTWGSMAFFAITLVADMLGYVSLSAVLGNALLRSSYMAVFLYTLAKIVDAGAIFLLNNRPLKTLAIVKNHRSLFALRAHQVIMTSGILLWTLSTLEMLAIRKPLFTGLKLALTTPATFGSISLSLGNLIAFGLTLFAAFFFSRFLRFLLNEDIFPRLKLGQGLPFAITMVLHYIILVIGFLMAIAALGFDMTKFTILAGAFGVGVGFGTQNIINNFVSGLIVLFERPVKLGDVIQIDDVTGRVEHIGIRATKIRTGSGSEVILPNATLISGRVTNWTGTNGLRTVEMQFAVAADKDPQRMIELLKTVAAAHPLVSKTPAPEVYFLKEDGASHVFELRLWTAEVGSLGRIKSDLSINFQIAIAKAQAAPAPATSPMPDPAKPS